MQIAATFMFKGDAYIVFVNGDIYKIEPDPATTVRISRITTIPWFGRDK